MSSASDAVKGKGDGRTHPPRVRVRDLQVRTGVGQLLARVRAHDSTRQKGRTESSIVQTPTTGSAEGATTVSSSRGCRASRRGRFGRTSFARLVDLLGQVLERRRDGQAVPDDVLCQGKAGARQRQPRRGAEQVDGRGRADLPGRRRLVAVVGVLVGDRLVDLAEGGTVGVSPSGRDVAGSERWLGRTSRR